MVLGFPGPGAGTSLKQTWKTRKTWKTCFVHGFGLPRPGGRNKFETDLEKLENLENLFLHGLGLRSVSLARDRSQWSLTCKFPVPFTLALVWGTYIPHGDSQHTFSQTFEQTKSTRHAQ